MDARTKVVADLRLTVGSTPKGDAIFAPTDAEGNPGDLNITILHKFKVPDSKMPDADLLRDGYYLLPVGRQQTIIFIVTVGAGNVQQALKKNLRKALRDQRLSNAKHLWLPLMGTGAGGLTNTESLTATLDALEAKWASRADTKIEISAPPSIARSELAELRLTLTSRARASKEKSAPPRVTPAPSDPTQTKESKPELVVDPIAESNGQVDATFVNDLATDIDSLDHSRFAQAMVDFLTHEKTQGPLSVSIQAPWGAGKSSLMRLIRSFLDPEETKRLSDSMRIGDPRRKSETGERLTLRRVLSFLDRQDSKMLDNAYVGNPAHRWTVWFNAWKYESSDQVWAGLVDAIVTQISDRLDPIQRELFLLRLHMARIDDGVIRRKIYERVVDVWWTRIRGWLLAAGAAILSFVGIGTVAPKVEPISAILVSLGLREASLSTLGLSAALIVAISSSIYATFAFIRSQNKVKEEPARFSLAEYLRVPDYQKTVGVVHQIHDDLRRVLRVLPKREDQQAKNRGTRATDEEPAREKKNLIPQPLVIFIDDLDRCSPNKVANVVEGVNMFLASDLYECIFIIGMDPQMVAAALEQAHKDVRDRLPSYERSVPLGWRFMDKFIQLPFTIPQCEPTGIEGYVRMLLPAANRKEKVETAVDQPPQTETRNTENKMGEGNDHILGEQSLALRMLERFRDLMRTILRIPRDEENKGNGTEEAISDGQHLGADVSREEVDERDVHKVMFALSMDVSNNPREIKRLLNMVRFSLLLRAHRVKSGRSVPEIEEYQRWIFLSLRWPDMMRWLQWGGEHLLLSAEDAQQRSSVSRRLARLEIAASESKDLAEWRKCAATRLGFEGAVSWLDDPQLFEFFKKAASINNSSQRFSAAAAQGFY